MGAAEEKIDPNSFKPITDPTERSLIFRAVAQINANMQVKSQDAAGKPTGELANIRAEKAWGDNFILGTHLNGPTLVLPEASLVFEVTKSLFFCLAKVLPVGAGQYSFEVGSLYSLQRRDTFRVPIYPSLIKAVFKVSAIGGRATPIDLPLVDLSEGGMGLSLKDDQEKLFSPDVLCSGSLCINKHPGFSLTLQIRYVRRIPSQGKLILQAGGAFRNINASGTQKIAALVNECHRLIFSKIASESK
ncbi:unnamed protein product [Sphagnum balticum]